MIIKTKPPFTLEEHKRLGLYLKRLYYRLQSVQAAIKPKHKGNKLYVTLKHLGEVISRLDSIVYRDYDKAGKNVYYGCIKEYNFNNQKTLTLEEL